MPGFTRLSLLLALSFMLFSCGGDKQEEFAYSSSEETGFAIPEDLMGMCHTGYKHEGNAALSAEDEYGLLDELGIKWIQRDFSWWRIQPAGKADADPADWDWAWLDQYVEEAANHNKKILGMLLYGVGWIHDADCGHPLDSERIVAGENEVSAFCIYAYETAKRYKGKVGAWCIWNEPNLEDRFWKGTAEEFFILTKEAATAIRQADPDAVILGGALNTLADDDTWTRGLIESGAMDQVDSFAYHPYLTDAVTSSNRFINFRDYIAGIDQKHADNIWVTEVGYPMLGNYGTEVAEKDMPEMVTKTITLLAVAKAQRIFWYQFLNSGANGDPEDAEDWFGLVDGSTYEKKGGADGYQLCAHNIPGKTWRSQLPLRSTELSGFIKAYYFEGADNTHTLIVWNEVTVRPQQVRVTLPGTNQRVWDVKNGEAAAIGEASTYTLQEGDGLRIFTWENGDKAKVPQISRPAE